MLSKKENIQNELILYTMEQLVPEDSLYRKIDKYIDFSFIYDELDEFGHTVDAEHSSRTEDLNKSDFDDIIQEEKELSAKKKKGKKTKNDQTTLTEEE